MDTSKPRPGIRDLLIAIEPRVNNLLVLLSFVSIVLVMLNEYLSQAFAFPILHVHWSEVNMWLRSAIWLIFVMDFISYALISPRRFQYARRHILELIICVAWFPHPGPGLLSRIFASFLMGGLLTADVLQLIGTCAHGWRVVRFTAQRFATHPMLIIGSATLLLIGSVGALLNHFEPQTYKTFWDGAWYSLTCVTTNGDNSYTPRTSVGRWIAVPLFIGGVALAGMFIASVSSTLGQELFKHGSKSTASKEQSPKEPDANQRLQEQILEELRANNALQQQILQELRRPPETTQEPKSSADQQPLEEPKSSIDNQPLS